MEEVGAEKVEKLLGDSEWLHVHMVERPPRSDEIRVVRVMSKEELMREIVSECVLNAKVKDGRIQVLTEYREYDIAPIENEDVVIVSRADKSIIRILVSSLYDVFESMASSYGYDEVRNELIANSPCGKQATASEARAIAFVELKTKGAIRIDNRTVVLP